MVSAALVLAPVRGLGPTVEGSRDSLRADAGPLVGLPPIRLALRAAILCATHARGWEPRDVRCGQELIAGVTYHQAAPRLDQRKT